MRHSYDNPEYKAWCSMRERCNNPNHPSYKNYGGRGISIHASFDDFDYFLEVIGLRFEGGTLERIDNNWDYEPGNIKWVTMKEQSYNRRNTKLTKEDIEHIRLAPNITTQEMLGELYGVNRSTIGKIQRQERWVGI